MIRYVIYAIDRAFYLDITRTHILVLALSFLLPKARAPTLTLPPTRREPAAEARGSTRQAPGQKVQCAITIIIDSLYY